MQRRAAMELHAAGREIAVGARIDAGADFSAAEAETAVRRQAAEVKLPAVGRRHAVLPPSTFFLEDFNAADWITIVQRRRRGPRPSSTAMAR